MYVREPVPRLALDRLCRADVKLERALCGVGGAALI